MKAFWIGNGKTVLPDEICENGSVLVRDGKIVAVNEPCPDGAEVVDAEGGYILPGFIDLHVHGGGGADFMDADPDGLRTIARTHAKFGTTGLCPTSMTSTNDVLERAIKSYLAVDEKVSGGAQLLGIHLEGPYFSTANKGAQPVGEQRIPTREEMEHIIALGEGKIVRWDEAPELPNTDVFAEVTREHGIMASIAHTDGIAADANRAFEMGFSHITHFYSATTTGRKINGWCYSGVNEATFLNDDISVEIIADGMHIPREHMLVPYRIKGADMMALITDAMRAAGTDDEYSVLGAKDTGVPVIIKDGVAQLLDLSFYAGSVGTMDRALRVAHVRYGIPLVDAVKMMSLTPARLIGRDGDKGSLTPGKDADVVIMDPEFAIKSVFVRGDKI